MGKQVDTTLLVAAKTCRERLSQDGICTWDKAYFSRLHSSGKIPSHPNPTSKRKLYLYDEVKQAVIDMRSPSRDADREKNEEKREAKKEREQKGVKKEQNASCPTLLDENMLPKDSWATMSEEEKKKRHDEMQETMNKLKSMSSEEDNLNRPTVDASAGEWNTFKIMQQGLNYEIDRKVKEKRLIYLDDFKAVAEILLSPLNQSLDDLPFSLKSRFPDVADDVIEYLLSKTNSMKVDVQNVSV